MNMEELAKHLPEQPRPGMAEWIRKNFWKSELGGNLCIFSRTSIALEDEQIGMTMTAEDWERYEHGVHHAWAAECQCTACGEKFITGWNKNHPNSCYGIKMYYGDDGFNYPGYIPEDAAPSVDIGVYDEGDAITCPFCGKNIRLIHKKSLRHGRTYQLLVTSVEVVDNYAVLVTWIASRYVDGESSLNKLNILPREALAIEGKKLYRFKHFDLGGGFYRDKHLEKWTPTNYYNDDLSVLSWNDGNLCIRIARSEQELIAEGKTLHHCVGSYGRKHASQTDCIFFVRRYRRPERSYYTLDINMMEAVPCEVQLHG